MAEEALMRRHNPGQDTLGAVAVPPLGAAFDLAVTHLERGADVVGLQLGHRPPLPLGGLPAALAQPAGDHHPVALAQGVGQVASDQPKCRLRGSPAMTSKALAILAFALGSVAVDRMDTSCHN